MPTKTAMSPDNVKVEELMRQLRAVEGEIFLLEVDRKAIVEKLRFYKSGGEPEVTKMGGASETPFGPSDAVEFVLRGQPTKAWSMREVVDAFRRLRAEGKVQSSSANERTTVRWALTNLRKKKIVEALGSRSTRRYRIRGNTT